MMFRLHAALRALSLSAVLFLGALAGLAHRSEPPALA